MMKNLHDLAARFEKLAGRDPMIANIYNKAQAVYVAGKRSVRDESLRGDKEGQKQLMRMVGRVARPAVALKALEEVGLSAARSAGLIRKVMSAIDDMQASPYYVYVAEPLNNLQTVAYQFIPRGASSKPKSAPMESPVNIADKPYTEPQDLLPKPKIPGIDQHGRITTGPEPSNIPAPPGRRPAPRGQAFPQKQDPLDPDGLHPSRLVTVGPGYDPQKDIPRPDMRKEQSNRTKALLALSTDKKKV